MSDILIKNGKIWNGESFRYADILTENNKILKIEKDISADADFVFDAKNKIVSSGFIDTHMHIKGISADCFGTDIQMGCIPFGVTFASDASGTKGNEDLLGSFLVKSGVFVSLAAEFTESDLKAAQDRFLKYNSKVLGIKMYLEPKISAAQNIKYLERVISFAQKRNLPVMLHCSDSPIPMAEVLQYLRCGDILTHAYHGGVNNVSTDEFKSLADAKKRGVIIDTGCAGNVHINFKVFGDAIKCGAIPDTISTDLTKLSVYKRGGRYGMTMCMSIAKHLGMTEEEIFKSVTSVPAKVLGLHGGCLKAGGTADIAVVEYTNDGFDLTDKSGNRIFSDTGYRCNMTVIDGEIVYIN